MKRRLSCIMNGCRIYIYPQVDSDEWSMMFRLWYGPARVSFEVYEPWSYTVDDYAALAEGRAGAEIACGIEGEHSLKVEGVDWLIAEIKSPGTCTAARIPLSQIGLELTRVLAEAKVEGYRFAAPPDAVMRH